MARWFGRKPRQPARNPGLCETSNAGFTTEAIPELTEGARALFNTPVEDCDPELLQLILSVFAMQLAEMPELGLSDAKALFATLWQRLGAPFGDTTPDTARAEESDHAPEASLHEVPTAPAAPPGSPPDEVPTANAAPEAPPASRPDESQAAHAAPEAPQDEVPAAHAAPEAPPTSPLDEATANNAAPEAPPPPDVQPETTAFGLPGHATIAAAGALKSPGNSAIPPRPGRRRRRSLHYQDRRRLSRHRRALTGRVPRGAPQTPPSRRLCYAACAGPP